MSAAIDMTNIEPLPSGSFRLRMQVSGKSLRTTYRTAEEAAAVRDAAKRELADENYVVIDGQAISGLRDAFLRSRKGNRAADSDDGRWDNHVAKAEFVNRAPGAVTRRDILDWLDALKDTETGYLWGDRPKKPLALQTRRHCLNLVRKFFEWAMDRELAVHNPCVGVQIEREDGDEEEGYQDGWYHDAEEQPRFLAVWDSFEKQWERDEKLIVQFSIGSGLREGEQWCLHDKDVHLDGPKPHAVVQYGSWDPKKKRYRSPKGRKGEKKTRIVPLFGMALEAARAWVAIRSRYAPRNVYGLFFPTMRGKRRTKAPRTWKRAIEKYGVIQRIGRKAWWHLNRHTCASSMVGGWWGKRWLLQDIAPILGHTTVKTTERYAHLAVSVVHDVATSAEAAWQLRSQKLATGGRNNGGSGTKNRPSKPDVVSSNLTGRAESSSVLRGNVVATAAALLQRIGDGDPVSTREWVDATCELITALRDAEGRRPVASAGGAR